MRLLHPPPSILYRKKNDSLKLLFNSLSTIPTASRAKSNDKDKQDDKSTAKTSTLLYRRRPSGANFPRAILTFSTLHTGYWSWYVFDFTPYVQQVAATVETDAALAAVRTAAVASSFNADTTIGYLGLGLAIFMSFGSVIFPQSLIQEIQLEKSASDERDQQERQKQTQTQLLPNSSASLLVRTYSLPFITPSSTTKYPLGNIIIDSPGDIKKIITDYGGNIAHYSGYLPIHAEGKRINLLLQLTDAASVSTKEKGRGNNVENNGNENEIYEKDTLFKSLVPTELQSVLDNDSSKHRKKASDSNGNKAKVLAQKQKRLERRLLRRR